MSSVNCCVQVNKRVAMRIKVGVKLIVFVVVRLARKGRNWNESLIAGSKWLQVEMHENR